jgi:hypothetical protein
MILLYQADKRIRLIPDLPKNACNHAKEKKRNMRRGRVTDFRIEEIPRVGYSRKKGEIIN